MTLDQCNYNRIQAVYLARPERFELPTTWFEARCSFSQFLARLLPFLRFNLPMNF